MSKNLTRKGLALVSGAALVLTSLVGFAAPASANPGGVTLSPTTGATYTVFNTDEIALTATVSPLVPSATADAGLSWLIENPDQDALLLRFNFATATTEVSAKLDGRKADGSVIGIAADGTAGDANTAVVLNSDSANTSGDIVIDFAGLDIVSLVVYGFTAQAASARTLSIKVLEDADPAGTLTTANATARAGLGYGEGNASIAVQSWVEVSAAQLVDPSTASAKETVTFVDPASVSVISEIVRSRATGTNPGLVTHLNAHGDAYLTANVRFSRTDINLNQIDLTKWQNEVRTSPAHSSAVAMDDITVNAEGSSFAIANGRVSAVTPVGYAAGNRNAYGSVLLRVGVTGNALAAGTSYQTAFRHTAANAPTFVSPAFAVVTSPETGTATVTSAVTSTTDAVTASGAVSLRTSVNAFTYRAQARLDGADVEKANIPMVAVVQAGAFMPTGATLTVTGSTKQITRANEAVIVSGLSNADGRFSVTVTSNTAATLQSYVVTFHVANSAGAFVVDATPKTASYVAAVVDAASATPSIAASSSVTVKVAVTDQFGQAISTHPRGALNVRLQAPNRTNLELFAPVVNGEASFTFTNYLTAGQSDILTARVYTGTSTNPNFTGLPQTNVSLFSVVDAAAVNVAAEVTGVEVNYADFITGKTSAAKPGPTSGTTYTGTVVNANGGGIAGAVVTVSAPGFQFKSGTDFTIGSVTLVTDAAGIFSVDFWTHTASAAGVPMTVTSGAATATTTVKSAVPTTMSPANLSFTWNLPATLVMNTTYAVAASVTDKWGNPIAGAEVEFSAFGSGQFNGVSTPVTRTTDRTGKATAFLRSFANVDGPGAIGATLNDLGAITASPALTTVLTNVVTTEWDESNWSDVIEVEINFLKTAPAASADGKVNVGSFNGKLVVYALGLDGARISWKVAGRWGVANAVGNTLNRFDRPVGAAGRDVIVEIYVDRVLAMTKTVRTR